MQESPPKNEKSNIERNYKVNFAIYETKEFAYAAHPEARFRTNIKIRCPDANEITLLSIYVHQIKDP